MTEIQLVENESTGVLSVSRAEAQKYEAYEKWYENRDGLFTALGKFTAGVLGSEGRITLKTGDAKLRSSVENLRNPVHRVVEFYATTLLSGPLEDALKVESKDDGEDGAPDEDGAADTLKEAVEQVWAWSTLAQNKQVAKRHLALYGQVFIKVVKPESKDHCYLQFIKPEHVTDFDADERGNLTYVRLDTPDVREEAGQTRKVWVTEIWRKGETSKGETKPGYVLFGESKRTNGGSVPNENVVEKNGKRVSLGAGEAQDGYPFDFVPFVLVNAADTGKKRPDPVYAHGLHLISWVCREATRLSDLMFRFNKAFKVIFGMGNDAQGRPLPPPKPGNVRSLDTVHKEQQAAARGEHTVPFGGSRASILSRENEDISIEGIAVTGLPGTAQMADATPNINYEAARVWINDHLREIEEELPELLYYSVESRANQSGAALRTLIAGAVSRAEEMQANLVTGLVKATKMALTVAQLAELNGFSEAEIGTYEAVRGRGFDFDIEAPQILPETEAEKQAVQAGKLKNAEGLLAVLAQVGVPAKDQRRVILTELGYEDLIEKATDPAADELPDMQSMQNIQAAQRQVAARFGTRTGGLETEGEDGSDSAR